MSDVVVGVLGRSLSEEVNRTFTAAGLHVEEALRADALAQTVDVVICPMAEVDSISDRHDLLAALPIVVAGARTAGPMRVDELPFTATEYFYWEDLEANPVIIADRIGRIGRAQYTERIQEQLYDAVGVFDDVKAVFSEKGTDTDERLDSLLTRTADRLGYPIAYITRINDGKQEIVASVGDHDRLQPGMSSDIANTYCQTTISTDEPVVIPDVSATDVIEEHAFEEYELSCYVGATIYVDDAVYGTFCFADTNPREELVTDIHGIVVKTLADRTGAELSEPISQLRTVFNEAPNPIVVYTDDGDVVDANKRACEQFQYSYEEICTMEVTELGIELTDNGWMPAVAADPTIVRGEYNGDDSGTTTFELWIAAVKVAGQRRFVAIAQDITARIEYEQRLETQRNSLELLNEVMRHDIRNDLQLIQAYAEELTEHVDDAGETAVQVIKDAAEHSIELTVTGRDLAEVILESHGELDEIELAPVVEAQCAAAQEADPDATITIDGTVPDVTVAGTRMLETVFWNVLKNALQHTNKNEPTVTVSAAVVDDTVTVRIADDGPGVPDAQKEEIFGHGTHGLDSAGSGIGLYLVQTLVTEYGGTAWVEDNDPEGAVFVIELPVL